MLRPFVIDKERDLSHSNDLLGTKCYVEQLVDTIKNIPQQESYTIGLYGSWGSGKSTIIETAKQEIEKSKENKYKMVVYDAWKYSGDSFRRMFLLHLQHQLGLSPTEEMKNFYQATTEEIKPKIKIRIPGVIICGIAILVTIVGIVFLNYKETKEVATLLALGISLCSLCFTLLGACFYELKVTQTKNILFAPEQFEECFRQMMKMVLKNTVWYKKIWNSINNNFFNAGISYNLDKLVIVIDNLDRCETEVVYSMLTDIKTFLGGEKYDVVFIIPVDDEALKKHLFVKYEKELDRNCQDAEEFLRKFFNVVIHIKQHRSDDLLHYIYELNKDQNLNFKPTTLSLIAYEYSQNPRRLLQMLNNLTVEQSLYADDFANKKETLIAACMILRDKYFEMVDFILANPTVLFSDSCYEESEHSSLPQSLKNNNGLCSFMRLAKYTFQNAKYEDMRKIFTNTSNSLSNLNDECMDAVSSFDFSRMLKAVENKSTRDDMMIEICRIVKLDNSYDAEDRMIQMAECLAKINYVTHLRIDELRTFNKVLFRVFDLIPSKVSCADEVCKFAQDMEIIGEKELKKSLINFIENAENKRFSTYHNYVRSILKIFNDAEDSKNLCDFAKTYMYLQADVNTFEFSDEQKTYLLSSEFVSQIINDLKTVTNQKQRDLLVWCYSNLLSINSNVNDELFKQCKVVFDENAYKPINEYINVIEFILPILRAIQIEGYNNSMSQFYSLITNARRMPNGTSVSISQEANEAQANMLVDFCLELYRISGKKLTINPFLLQIQTKCEGYFKTKLTEIQQSGASLIPFRKNVIEFKQIDDDWYKLIPIVFEKSSDDKYLDDATIKNKLMILLQHKDNDMAVNILVNVTKDEHIKNLFISTLDLENYNTLNQLPEKLLPLIVELYTENTTDEFEDNNSMLKIVLHKGSIAQKQLVRTSLVNRINKNIDLDGVIDIISYFEKWNKTDKKVLGGVLQGKMPDEQDVEQLKEKNVELTDIQKKILNLLDSWNSTPKNVSTKMNNR
ncbi:MAG: KAP family NTPase [Paludibacteraceae bacterium]|nr:KAP family NTPase [Paludibacteraceae bacterium]